MEVYYYLLVIAHHKEYVSCYTILDRSRKDVSTYLNINGMMMMHGMPCLSACTCVNWSPSVLSVRSERCFAIVSLLHIMGDVIWQIH